MSRHAVGSWLVDNAGMISVFGALVIFFSWVVTNTLGQRYSRMKQSAETAESTFRLYTTLHELRSSLNSVASETVYGREAAERNQGETRYRDKEEEEIALLRRRYDHTRLSAHQINELMDFANQTLEVSNGIGTSSETAQRIETIYHEIYEVYWRVHELDRVVQLANATPKPDISKLRPAVEQYDTVVRQIVNDRVPDLFRRIAEASNTRREEGRFHLADTKKNAERAARVGLILYILGSMLALGGQYVDKVQKPRAEKAKMVEYPPALEVP
jgi:hypothetical protein